jgi:hypothetical protein
MADTRLIDLQKTELTEQGALNHYQLHIDTSMLLNILRHGSIGQVLTRTGPGPYDFKWV